NLNAGNGTISISANTAGTDSAGYAQATGATLTTTNTSASAVTINVNTASGGTGSATLGNASVGTSAGGIYNVNANSGTIAWNNVVAARSAASTSNAI